MKCYFIIREDLYYTSDRLFKLAVKNATKINNPEWLLNPKSETLMMFNVNLLHSLEATLIENGIEFEWIEENKTLIGLMILPTTKSIIPPFLADCLTLKEYAVLRQKEFNELSLEKLSKNLL